jgi:uncharacterized protein (DUF58 family)
VTAPSRPLRPAAPTNGGPYADPAPEPPDEPAGPVWGPTRALGRAVLLCGLLLLGGVLLGRIDLVVLAMPFAVGTAVALRRRPNGRPHLRLSLSEDDVGEGAEVSGTVHLANTDAADYPAVVVRTRVSPWLSLAGADRPRVAVLNRGEATEIALGGAATRWGRPTFGPAAVRAVACDGLLAGVPVGTAARRLRVFPVTAPFRAVEAMPRAAGLVGVHRSRRPGEGGELAGVRVFAPGDRLRRVDWRVSLRAGQLHVASTLSDRDAEVVLLVDVLTEAGVSGGVHGAPSVLDATVRAAAAVAEHYLHLGDRVSLVEYGPRARRLGRASGRRQYLRVLEWLLDVRAEASPKEPYERVFGLHATSGNALLVVLTPLVDERSAMMLARLARAGRFMVAVDTLPPGARPPHEGQWTGLAYRLWRLERENTLGELREHGVPVVRWAGAGSLDLVLRDVARLASAPRVGAR